MIAEAFRQRGVEPPEICMKTISVHLRTNRAASGRFITTFARSVMLLYAERFGLRRSPIDLPGVDWPIKMATLTARLARSSGALSIAPV